MKFFSTVKFAVKNIKANRTLFLPYILSSSLMLSVMYIMSSLLSNEYINTRHVQLSIIMGMGIAVTFIFVVAFIIYISSFINKKRSMEMSLYNILGLEKKHIIRIVFAEQILIYGIIAVLSIIGGYVFGRISFMILAKLIKDVGAAVTDYPFSFVGFSAVIITLAFLFIVNLLINIKRISFSSATELMTKSKSNEEMIKSRKFFAVAGIILLGAGYFIALTTKGFLESLWMFFVAVLLVIFGSYLFFIFSTTMIFRGMKNNKKFFYNRKNFFWVSEMLTRLKSNGASMATITVLSTCILVTLSSTLTINYSMNNRLEEQFPKEYILNYYNQNLDKISASKLQSSIEEVIEKSQLKGMKAENINYYITKSLMGYIEDDGSLSRIEGFTPEYYKKDERVANVKIKTLNTFNQENNTDIKLNDGEVLVSKIKNDNFAVEGKIKAFGRIYNVKNYEFRRKPTDVFSELEIIVKDEDTLVQMSKDALKNSGYKDLLINVGAQWNESGTDGRNEEFAKKVTENIKEYKVSSGLVFSSKSETEKEMYAFNGGFIFMGVIVSIVFLLGIVLVTYYKQVFEGYADRENTQIMKKIGLDKELIKKNSNIKMMWFFITPLVVAPVNTLIASKMLYTLLTLFGLGSYLAFFKIMMIIFLVFFAIYFILFKITSRVYLKIVN